MTKAFDTALRLLTNREHGAQELTDKLVQKGFAIFESQAAVEKCQSLGLQSDERFSENFCRARIRQGYGPVKIRMELKSKGLSKESIDIGLLDEQDNWLEHAMTVWQKKYKNSGTGDFKVLQKKQRFLLDRGFPVDIISAVVKQVEGYEEF